MITIAVLLRVSWLWRLKALKYWFKHIIEILIDLAHITKCICTLFKHIVPGISILDNLPSDSLYHTINKVSPKHRVLLEKNIYLLN